MTEETKIEKAEHSLKAKKFPLLLLPIIFGCLVIICASYKFISQMVLNSNTSIENILKESTSQKEGYEDDNESTIYEFFADNPYNQIVKFNDKGTTVYAFKKETDTPIGNGGFFFNYELGRIKINPNDKNGCQCTYNFISGYNYNSVEWFKCSEKSFIKDLPKIIQVKEEKFKALKETLDYEKIADNCGYVNMEKEPECKNLPDRDFEEVKKLREKQIEELRNARF